MKKLLTITLLIMSSLLLASCDNPTDEDLIKIIQVTTDLVVQPVLSDFSLPTNIDEVKISWESSNTKITINSGVIIMPYADTSTVLTATLSYKSLEKTKDFNVTILATGSNDYNFVVNALNELSFAKYELTDSIELLTSSDIVTISWESNNPDFLTNSGIVTRPLEDEGNETIILTAILTYKEVLLEKDFVFTIFGLSQTAIYTDYYLGADGLTGDNLKLFLHNLIDDHDVLSYTELWTALAVSDEDPNNSNNVILLYTGRSQSKLEIQSGNNYQDYWNPPLEFQGCVFHYPERV